MGRLEWRLAPLSILPCLAIHAGANLNNFVVAQWCAGQFCIAVF